MCNSFNISGYFLNSNILIPFQTRTTTIEPFATHVLKKVIASWSLWPFCLYSRISVCLTDTPSTLNVVWVGLGASFFAMIQIINARQFNGERVSSIPSRHYFANVDSNFQAVTESSIFAMIFEASDAMSSTLHFSSLLPRRGYAMFRSNSSMSGAEAIIAATSLRCFSGKSPGL